MRSSVQGATKVGDTLTATPDPENATNIESYAWLMGDAVDKVDTVIEDATTSSLTVTDAMAGKWLKVVVTDTEGNKFEAKTTAAVEKVVVKPVVTEVKQIAANKIEVTFDVAAKDEVNKDNLKVERVDGLAVIPVNALEWSEDGVTATATLSSSLVDQIDYQVSYDGGAAASFKASVGKVASIAILTASAEENVKTDVKFALYDANGVDVTSSINVDTDCEVAIEGVDGAVVTADTSKPSKAAVTMTKKDDKAKVTVTYRADESLAPQVGEIVCTAAKATVGTQHVRSIAVPSPIAENSVLKVWSDGSYCARFEVGTDATSVTTTLGSSNNGIFFTATDENEKYISYDSYEVSSSNEDVASAAIEDNIDSGKYCRIAVSGNTVGTANVLVKAIKNGADYTYVIPVKVVAERKLTGISAVASRTSMSNAIDTDYSGQITVTGKYNDGTTANLTAAASYEIADLEKKQGYSTNLMAVEGITTQADADTSAKDSGTPGALYNRHAETFEINADGVADATAVTRFAGTAGKYTAYGAQGTTYTIAIAASDTDGKEYKTSVSVKVSDLAQAAWDPSTTAKMEYSMEFDNGNALDAATPAKRATTAKLAAYANKLFAGYVRVDSLSNVQIGTGVVAHGATPEVPASIIKTIGGAKVEIEAAGDTGAAVSEKDLTITPGAAGSGVAAAYASGVFTLTVASDNMDTGTLATAVLTITNGCTTNGNITIDSEDIAVTTAASTAVDVAGLVAAHNFTNWEVVQGTGTDNDKVTFTKKAPATAGATGLTLTVAGTGVIGNFVEGTTGVAPAAIDAADIQTAMRAAAGAPADVSTKLTVTASTGTESTTGKFSKYTAASAAVDAVGSAFASTETAITDIWSEVKFGSKYGDGGAVYDAGTNIARPNKYANYAAATTKNQTATTIDIFDGTGTEMLVGNSAYDAFIAKPGTYTVGFYYTMNAKAAQAESTVTVKNSLVGPKVTVNERVIDSLSVGDIQDALTINVDALCNLNEADSLDVATPGIWKNDKSSANGIFGPSTAGSDSWTVNYFSVDDNGITYIVPVTATFKTE